MKLFGWTLFAAAMMAAGWGTLMWKFSGEEWVGWMTGSILFAVVCREGTSQRCRRDVPSEV